MTYVGAGRQRQVQFRRDHPLAPALEALFTAENTTFAEFLDALRAAAASIPGATAVWLEGPLTTGTDTLSEPVACFVIGAPARLPRISTELRDAFAPIERMYDVTIPIHGLTRSELATRDEGGVESLLDAILLAGTPPAAFHPIARERLARQSRITGHGDHDAHALATASVLADLVATGHEMPVILSKAKDLCDRRADRSR